MAAAQKLQAIAITADVLAEAMIAIAPDHPAKIIPQIREYLGSWRNRLVSSEPPKPIIPPERRIEPPAKPITIEEVRTMAPILRRIGLAKGFITQDMIDQAGGEQ
jgi:hypothetical protein